MMTSLSDLSLRRDFRHKSKKILDIAIPAGLNSLFDVVNIIIGIFIIGKLSSFHIVAVGLGANYFMLLFAVTNVFFVGTNAQISRLFGKGDMSGIQNVLSSMFWGAFVISFAVLFITNHYCSWYFRWIGSDEASQVLGEIFTYIMLLIIPAMFAKTIIISAMSACGDTKTPFKIKVFITLLNIALNFALIFGAQLDIVGMALANLIVAYIEILILLFVLIRRDSALKIAYIFIPSIFIKGVRIGIPVGFERGFTIISLILISKFVASYGSDYLAGLQIGSRIEAFAVMPGFGFMVASMALSGQFLGAGNRAAIREIVYLTMFLGAIFMGIMGVVMAVGGGYFSAFFSDKGDVIYSSVAYLVCVGISQIPLIFIFVLDGAYRGAGATKISLVLNTSFIWGLRILPMYVCQRLGFPLLAIYVIILVETFLRAGAFLYVFQTHFDRIFV